MEKFSVSSFYRFVPVDAGRLREHQAALDAFAAQQRLHGLIILATEGINGSVSGSAESVDLFQSTLPEFFGAGDWSFKRSLAAQDPFRIFRVKIRDEIVTTRDPIGVSVEGGEGKLSPEEWHSALAHFDPERAVLLDTRNRYETLLGMFEHATDPGLENFQEFERYVAESGIPKEKTVYMYCTGGIRCEKASIQMKRQGYQHVYQLEGGILRYLEQFPGEQFRGECFVFDGRVAVDQELNPTTRWVFCPHCGDPANVPISCELCGCSAKVCEACLAEEDRRSCSKNCAYQLRFRLSRRQERGHQQGETRASLSRSR